MNPNFAASKPTSASPVLGIVAIALGVIGLFMMVPAIIIWFCSVFPFVLGVAAVIVGFLGVSRVKRSPEKYSGKGLSIAGILVGVLAIILPTLYALLNLGFIAYNLSR